MNDFCADYSREKLRVAWYNFEFWTYTMLVSRVMLRLEYNKNNEGWRRDNFETFSIVKPLQNGIRFTANNKNSHYDLVAFRISRLNVRRMLRQDGRATDDASQICKILPSLDRDRVHDPVTDLTAPQSQQNSRKGKTTDCNKRQALVRYFLTF